MHAAATSATPANKGEMPFTVIHGASSGLMSANIAVRSGTLGQNRNSGSYIVKQAAALDELDLVLIRFLVNLPLALLDKPQGYCRCTTSSAPTWFR